MYKKQPTKSKIPKRAKKETNSRLHKIQLINDPLTSISQAAEQQEDPYTTTQDIWTYMMNQIKVPLPPAHVTHCLFQTPLTRQMLVKKQPIIRAGKDKTLD